MFFIHHEAANKVSQTSVKFCYSSSVTQMWSITLNFIHHQWDSSPAKHRFYEYSLELGNTSVANQSVDNTALLSNAEDSFLFFTY